LHIDRIVLYRKKNAVSSVLLSCIECFVRNSYFFSSILSTVQSAHIHAVLVKLTVLALLYEYKSTRTVPPPLRFTVSKDPGNEPNNGFYVQGLVAVFLFIFHNSHSSFIQSHQYTCPYHSKKSSVECCRKSALPARNANIEIRLIHCRLISSKN